MGGSGSSRWGWAHRRKVTVDKCPDLHAGDLRARRTIGANVHEADLIEWVLLDGRTLLMEMVVDTGDDTGALQLRYPVGKQTLSDRIELVTTATQFGGRRWWFSCPRCGRRCGVLYLPPGLTRWACRTCHDLAYRTSQEHNKVLERYLRMPTDVLQRFMDGADLLTAVRVESMILNNKIDRIYRMQRLRCRFVRRQPPAGTT